MLPGFTHLTKQQWVTMDDSVTSVVNAVVLLSMEVM